MLPARFVVLFISIIFTCIFILKATSFQPGRADIILAQADSLFSQRLFDQAFDKYTEAAQILLENDDTKGGLEAVVKAGMSLQQDRQIAKAVIYLKEYLSQAELLDELDDSRENFYNVLSEVYYQAGDAFNSLTYHTIVYSINVKRGDTPEEKMRNLTRIMGVLNFNSGQLQNGIVYYTKYADLIRNQFDDKHLLMSDAYNYLGIVYRYMGEYDMSRDYYSRALENALRYSREERQAINPRFASVAPLYNNMGNIYHDLKDHENALAHSLKAMEIRISENEADHPAVAPIHNGLGTTYGELKQYENALFHKQRALTIYKRTFGEKHGTIAITLKNLGDTYFDMGDYAKARDYYQQSLSMNLEVHGAFHPNTADSYAKLSAVDAVEDNLEGALRNMQLAIQNLIHEFDGSELYANPDVKALCNVKLQLLEKLKSKADLLLRLYGKTSSSRDLNAAYETYKLSIDLSEIIRNDLVDNRSKMYLAENVKSLYETTILTAWKLYNLTKSDNYLSEAFEVMEKNKSRLLLESIQDSQAKSTLDLPDSLFNQENGLKNRVAYFERLILDEQVKEQPDSLKVKEWNQGLFESRRALEVLVNGFKENYPNYHSAKYAIPTITSDHIQRNFLGRNDILLEFFSGDSALYMFCADKENVQLFILDTIVKSHTLEMLQGLQERNFDRYVTHAHEIYKLLIDPLKDRTAGKLSKIVIIPDGVISSIPFELLLTLPATVKNYQELPYSIHDHTFNYWFSSTLMVHEFQREHSGKRGQFIGFAPEFDGEMVATRGLPGNIPYAREEVTEIAETFNGQAFLGKEATESNFRNISEHHRIIHLATHAVTDERNPGFSRLFFATDDSLHDGMLHAYELMSLKLNTDLVTLSACNTAVGQWKEGEGIMSMARAFAYAGSPGIVTSLWPAQDQTTAEIMKLFYLNLSQGMNKDEALREAKLTYLQEADKVKSDPFFWAGFILVGDTAPVESRVNYFGWIALVLLLAVGVVAMRRRYKINKLKSEE